MILRWLRTIVLAVIGFAFLIAYSSAYQTVYIRTPAELFRSDFLPLIVLAIDGLPFVAGLMLGLAAFNGPIRGLKFSVLNFLAIALLPMLFGCSLPTLGAAARLLEPLRGLMRISLFREPPLLHLQPMMALVAGIGIGVAFIRGFQEPPPMTELIAAVAPTDSSESAE
jgi:hypothetical protein